MIVAAPRPFRAISDTINPPYSYQKKPPMDIVDVCRYFNATSFPPRCDLP
jgi:hypothetical protein